LPNFLFFIGFLSAAVKPYHGVNDLGMIFAGRLADHMLFQARNRAEGI